MRLFALLMAGSVAAWGQIPQALEYRHLYTFGSKEGIHPPKVLNKKPATIALGRGEHPYGLGFPVEVATDTRHRIWITDSGTASLHVFDPDHAGYREIRKVADVPLQQPSGIVHDGAGRMYLTDTATGGLLEIDDDDQYERSLLSKQTVRMLQGPTSVALSADRRAIFVLDPPAQSVVAFNREGETTGTIALPAEMRQPASISIHGNQLYVLDHWTHRVAILSTAGAARGELHWDNLPIPLAFTYDAKASRFAVADPRYMVVQIFDKDGQNLGAVGQLGDRVDEVRRIDAVHLDSQGRVYIVDSRRGKVVVFGPAGE